MKKFLIIFALWASCANAQDIPNHSIPIGKGPGIVGWGIGGPCSTGQGLVQLGPARRDQHDVEPEHEAACSWLAKHSRR